MRHIQIPIPEKKDFKRWFEILMFKLRGGFKCKGCGEKMQYKCFKVETDVLDKRLMFSNNTPYICPSCAVKELSEKADVIFTEHESKCDWCQEVKDTTSFPRHESLDCNVHIGGQWWNGHHICKNCLTEIKIQPLTYTSGIYKQIGDRMYPMNELGLPVRKK